MTLHRSVLFALAGVFAVTALPVAEAKPVRSNGAACDSIGTARKTGTDQNGNKLDCLWDTCTFSECSTSGGTVSNCVQKTEYSNARDCKAAAKSGASGAMSPAIKGGNKLQKAQ